jgi:hypothetical protein
MRRARTNVLKPISASWLIRKPESIGVLAEFASVIDAVRCATEIQRAMADREPEVPVEWKIRLGCQRRVLPGPAWQPLPL